MKNLQDLKISADSADSLCTRNPQNRRKVVFFLSEKKSLTKVQHHGQRSYGRWIFGLRGKAKFPRVPRFPRNRPGLILEPFLQTLLIWEMSFTDKEISQIIKSKNSKFLVTHINSSGSSPFFEGSYQLPLLNSAEYLENLSQYLP